MSNSGLLQKNIIEDIIGAPKGTPIMLDTSRIFEQDSDKRDKPVYVAVEGKRFYGRDPSDLVKNLPTIIKATQREGFAKYSSNRPSKNDVASFAAESVSSRVSRNENNNRRQANLRREAAIELRRREARAARKEFFSGARRGAVSFSKPFVYAGEYAGKVGKQLGKTAISSLQRPQQPKLNTNSNTNKSNRNNPNTKSGNTTRKNKSGLFSRLFGTSNSKPARPGSTLAATKAAAAPAPVATPPAATPNATRKNGSNAKPARPGSLLAAIKSATATPTPVATPAPAAAPAAAPAPG